MKVKVMPAPPEISNCPALRCVSISKRFGFIAALCDAQLCVGSGTVHALVGENGAGKSTLINIVSGMIKPDGGAIDLFGETVRFASARDAANAGLGIVHQHFLLADAMTVAENIALGHRTSSLGWRFDRKKSEADAARLAEESGLNVDPKARVHDLPVGMRQRVEILKALSRGAKILLLDEPTAVLAPPEVESLFNTLRSLRDSGRTIVIVTHKLDEVFSLASDVTVLREGRSVFAGSLRGVTPADLAEKMIGRHVPRIFPGAPPSAATPSALSISGVKFPGRLDVEDLEIKSGEIVGVAGVEGNGQRELAAILAGTAHPPLPLSATLLLGTTSLKECSVRERSRAGLAFIPGDRHLEGLVLDMSLTENLYLRSPALTRAFGFAFLDHAAMRKRSGELLHAFSVHPPQQELPAHALSGGNQQKVVIARELHTQPKVIVAFNPTRGLDVGAAAEVHSRLLSAARDTHAGVLLISSDLDEVLALSDRIAVLYRGRLSILGSRGMEKSVVGRAMVGAL